MRLRGSQPDTEESQRKPMVLNGGPPQAKYSSVSKSVPVTRNVDV
jgi:hypothetical protein